MPRRGTKGGRSLCCVQHQLTKVSTAQALALTAIHHPEMRGQWLHQLPVPDHGPQTTELRAATHRLRRHDSQNCGQRVRGCPQVLHITDEIQLYLEVKIERVERLCFDAVTFAPINEEQLVPYIKKKRPSRQKLTKPVELRDYRRGPRRGSAVDARPKPVGSPRIRK